MVAVRVVRDVADVWLLVDAVDHVVRHEEYGLRSALEAASVLGFTVVWVDTGWMD